MKIIDLLNLRQCNYYRKTLSIKTEKLVMINARIHQLLQIKFIIESKFIQNIHPIRG